MSAYFTSAVNYLTEKAFYDDSDNNTTIILTINYHMFLSQVYFKLR